MPEERKRTNRTSRPPTSELLVGLETRLIGIDARMKRLEDQNALLLDSYRTLAEQVGSLERRWLEYINHRASDDLVP